MPNEYLNTTELAKLIGRSEAAIRNLVMRRRIPYRRAGGRLTFVRAEIDKWIDQAPGVKLEDLEEDLRR
jgi:excisionase family DNA binding protein